MSIPKEKMDKFPLILRLILWSTVCANNHRHIQAAIFAKYVKRASTAVNLIDSILESDSSATLYPERHRHILSV